MQRIYITGCARSGTTLLLRLFYAFQDTFVIPREIGLGSFVKSGDDLPDDATLVGKRTGSSLFSSRLSPQQIKRDLDLQGRFDVKIINIIRDGRDVIESGYAGCERWVESIRQFRAYGEHVSLSLAYEFLVENPGLSQRLVERYFDLEADHLWSEYPDFVPQEGFEYAQPAGEQYDPRPIDTTRIGKNPDLYKQKCPPGLIGDFENHLSVLGYKET